MINVISTYILPVIGKAKRNWLTSDILTTSLSAEKKSFFAPL